MPFLLLKIFRIAAAGLLLASLLLPWFCVPVSVHENGYGGYVAVLREAASTTAFKFFVAAVLLSFAWIAYRRGRRKGSVAWAMPMALSGCLLLVVLTIAYPALTIQRCASVSAHAAWLQIQNVSLIRVGGDVRTAQEYSHQPGEWDVSVKDILPRAFAAIPMPVGSFSKLRLARLPQLAMWLGFSPAFYEFARPGWFCGIFGAGLLVISLSRTKKGEGLARQESLLAHRMLLFIPGACLLWTFCLIPVVMAGRELNISREVAAEGKFTESLRHLDLAEAWIPVLAYHTDVLYQRGWLERKLGVNSRTTQLVSALREETEGFVQRAAQHYTELLDTEAEEPVRSEAFRGALRLAINDFNAGLLDRAASRLAQLL